MPVPAPTTPIVVSERAQRTVVPMTSSRPSGCAGDDPAVVAAPHRDPVPLVELVCDAHPSSFTDGHHLDPDTPTACSCGAAIREQVAAQVPHDHPLARLLCPGCPPLAATATVRRRRRARPLRDTGDAFTAAGPDAMVDHLTDVHERADG